METLRSFWSKNNAILLNQSSSSLKNVEIGELPSDTTQIRNDFTSLQILKVHGDIDSVIPMLKTRPSVLTSLSIEETTSTKAFAYLDHELMCLQKIHILWIIDCDNYNEDMKGAVNLINKSPNLIDLHLEYVGMNIDKLSACPQIKNITSLTLEPRLNEYGDYRPHSQFLRCCTSLTNLKLILIGCGTGRLAKREEWYLPSAKKAEITHIDKNMNVNDIEHHFSKMAEIDMIFDGVMYESDYNSDSD